ncbi:hypothetical protein BD779DRAFT_1045711 [Infundibulicybe gibba]|nr:hypothetical protein BD779DRAFT_1045711 [Infundibulicybe gibba]
MTIGFTHPPHPSTLRQSTHSLHPVKTKRDPHTLPTFDDKSLTEPDSPVLYLPPLLSSLPERFPSETITLHNPPLVTDTRLPDIDPASLSLHKALHQFRPVDSNYAENPYADAFNWSELVLPADEDREWYCVVFRSRRRPGSDGGRKLGTHPYFIYVSYFLPLIALYDADKKAHEEAVRNGGLIMYWYGIPNPQTGMNLATCIWQSRKHAMAANSQPYHAAAMRLAAQSFDTYNLERYRLQKLRGETGVTIEPFIGGDIGW